MLRDGSVYFGVMVISTVANILTYAYGGTITRGVATPFVNNISSVMITRLMLNLRNPTLSGVSQSSPIPSLDFNHSDDLSTFVGLRTSTGSIGRNHYQSHLECLAQWVHARHVN